jgi:UDP-galactose transporter B1
MGSSAHAHDHHHDHDHHHPRTLRTRLLTALALCACAAGIYGAYITQGLVSEHLQLRRYGPRNERFAHFEVLNGAQAAVCFVAAYVIVVLDWVRARLTGSGAATAAATAAPPPTPARATRAATAAAAKAQQQSPKVSPFPSPLEYWRPALSNAVGPAFGMVALRNISYSAQVLSKSCKMVPVMLASSLLHGRRYSVLEYAAMLLVGGGVGLFAAGGGKAGKGGGHGGAKAASLEAPNAPLGYLLVALNLALDGYTNAAQDDVNHRHPRNSPVRMMAWMNLWGTLYYGFYSFLVTTTGKDTLAFCARHPEAGRDLLLFCACGAVGQLFIFATIKRFGSVATSLVCTTRKFFSVLASSLYGGGAALTAVQWCGVAGVFAGLLGSMALKEQQHLARVRQMQMQKKKEEEMGGKANGKGVAVVATAAAAAASPSAATTTRRRRQA